MEDLDYPEEVRPGATLDRSEGTETRIDQALSAHSSTSTKLASNLAGRIEAGVDSISIGDVAEALGNKRCSRNRDDEWQGRGANGQSAGAGAGQGDGRPPAAAHSTGDRRSVSCSRRGIGGVVGRGRHSN